MKVHESILTFLLFIVLLEGCDPGYSFVISNKTDKGMEIKVIDVQLLSYRDSIMIFDTTVVDFYTDNMKSKIPIDIDSLNGSYSFQLGKYENALVDYGLGSLDLNQKIIIDERDTLPL